jgi:hypothetical protein
MTGLDSIGIETETSFELILKHPKKNTPLVDEGGQHGFIMLLGPDSAPARKAKRQSTQNALSRRNRDLDADELEAQTTEYLVAITTGWHLVNFEGKKIDYEFSPSNARKLYSNPQMAWIREDVDRASANRANFLQDSAKT